MSRKMIASYGLILLTGALFSGLLFFLHYQTALEAYIDSLMVTLAQSVEAALTEYPEGRIIPLGERQANATGMRISIIAGDGTVLADSEDSYANHGNREEIVKARENGSAFVLRRSGSTRMFYKFYAKKVTLGEKVLFIRIAKEMSPIYRLRTRVIIIFFSVAALLSLIFAWVFIVRSINNVRRLEKIRSEFVSNVTHELKTPLTSIKGFVDTLKQGAVQDEAVAEKFLDIIEIEADRLFALINDVMQLSEIESVMGKQGVSDYIINDIVSSVMEIMEPAARLHEVALSVKLSPAVSVVRINRDRLKQLLINLLDNAVKYTNPGGWVSLTCELSGNNVIFTVADNGIGISPEHHERIFERFYRVDKGRSRKRGGTGLGLSIVKHIVQLYDGKITVASREGEGTSFVISLPIAVTA